MSIRSSYIPRVLISILLFTALGVGLPAGGAGEATHAPVEERRVETDELVIYGYDSLPGTLRRAIAEHFLEEYDVEVDLQRIGDTGAVYTQLYLERENPRADVVIGLDSTYLPRLRSDQLLEPYRPANIDLVRPELDVAPDSLVVPYDFGYITLNYDSELLSDPPQSWDELLDPRLRNSIILMNPGTSSPGRNFLLYTIAVFGEEGYLEFWRELRPNILTVTGGWSDGYGLYTQQEAPIVLSYETSPAYHREFEETDRYQAVLFDSSAYLQVEVAGIVRGARNRLNAERLIEYIVSPEFQDLIALSQIMYPVHPEVQLPEAFLAGPRVENSVHLDPEYVAENFSGWLEAWEDVMR